MKWEMDIVGPLPQASVQSVFMLAMTDYFSKWIEAETFKQVRDAEVISFIKHNVLSRFGIPSEIVCDNGSQFISNKKRNYVPGTTSPCTRQPRGTHRLMAKKIRAIRSSSTISKSDYMTPKGSGRRTPHDTMVQLDDTKNNNQLHSIFIGIRMRGRDPT
ncbi:uncharacterized protein [Spinacia oleracea]|uniref:Integrase catalytic domain-containing protein n=1 Tax=Spinacia oleracea TaxID=3562 RepID=A0ABM3RQX1_SPIOL|nr:uncharacterized protein LOC130471748 [Spinacia oleracea]